MDRADQKIGDELRRITRTDRATHTLMSGKVVPGSIDDSAMTCSVLLTIDDNTAAGDDADVPTDNVMLNCVSMNSNGFLLYPADNSDVIVGEVDGPGQYTLIKCSNLLKAVINVTSGTTNPFIQFNNGSLGGLVKVIDLTTKLNNLEDKVNDFIDKWNDFCTNYVPGGPGATGQPSTLTASTETHVSRTAQNDIENKNITQG
jgi:hypothetical protein